MSAASIGALLAGTATKVTAELATGIWRSTYDVDDPRAKVGRPFGDGSARQSLIVIEAILATAKAWTKAHKPAGKIHPLTSNMIETLSCILHMMNFGTGDIEASNNMIMRATGFSRETVNHHKKVLRELGWLDWARRSIQTAKGLAATTACNFFFEISRLPMKAQMHLRQLLHKKGVTLQSHPERKGSGPVPNLAQRIAERIAKGCKKVADKLGGEKRTQRLVDEAAFIRGEFDLFGRLPTEQWAAHRYPNDPAAQRTYNARLGISTFTATPSPVSLTESPVEE